ncbi:MAG: ESCRT-III subunit protein snf7 [Chrysothrix sp. TS-e1954]|nr:MAG: ESCRT-III subunit protein snf7 [Chrysothrix sp. TS-e1954]
MSGWGAWFGGASTKKKEAPKNAILGLRSTMDMLSKREKHLMNQMDEQDAIARKNVNTNKTAAKAALRRKKGLEHTLTQVSDHMLTVERQISSIESANINKETMDAMKNASVAMKHIHNGLTIDKVDATMEDLSDQHAIAEEIGEALRGGPGANAVDEGELEEELQELQERELEGRMVGGSVPVGERLPGVAQGERESARALYSGSDEADIDKVKHASPSRQEDEEEEELRKLQAEMAM